MTKLRPYYHPHHDAQVIYAVARGEMPLVPEVLSSASTSKLRKIWSICGLCRKAVTGDRQSMSFIVGYLLKGNSDNGDDEMGMSTKRRSPLSPINDLDVSNTSKCELSSFLIICQYFLIDLLKLVHTGRDNSQHASFTRRSAERDQGGVPADMNPNTSEADLSLANHKQEQPVRSKRLKLKRSKTGCLVCRRKIKVRLLSLVVLPLCQ